MRDEDDAELLRLDNRNRVERLPLGRESSLSAALRKVPGKWTKAMCEALHLPASSRDTERKAAILDYLIAPGAVARVWRDLPEPSRRIVSWFVLENNGCSRVRELYGAFGADDDYSYHWNIAELPTTALGLLRLHGLVFKGMATTESGREKVAVVPMELRGELESIARGSGQDDSAPPMPEPAFRKKSGLWDPLDVKGRFWGSGRPEADVYQLRIVLKGVEPPVWRRIQVPGSYAFWDLHVAIQDAMGWLDYHLHEFRLRGPLGGGEVVLGFAEEGSFEGRKALTDYMVQISDYSGPESFDYLYDFGDEWLHEVTLEEVIPRRRETRYPVCVAGERACPPEDCGGVPGYAEFLRIMADPTDEEHEEMLRWAGGAFEPERFAPTAVHFDDPHLRWSVAYLGDEEARASLARRREAAAERPSADDTEMEAYTCCTGPDGDDTAEVIRFSSISREEPPVQEPPETCEVYAFPGTAKESPAKSRRKSNRSSSHKWQFKARFRRSAYGWKGTAPASKRLREAVSEIKKVARKDPVTAADGVVTLFERLWPALQGINSSSGGLGIAVDKAIDALLPFLIDAPADLPTRREWLECLYEAVCDDGVDFLFPVQCRWGEICVFPELVDHWIEFLLPGLELCQRVGGRGDFYDGETICLSCLLEGKRYDKLREVISNRRFPYWPLDRFWAEALARMGQTDDAIAFAESRNPQDYEKQSILEFCERVLLEAGREEEAYREYGLLIHRGNTYLATYRAMVKRYPGRDPEQVLRDLIETSLEKEKWFAAARQAGYLDIARYCARSGLVEPKTLVTAARDTLESDPGFSYEIALRALDLMLRGYGYELAVIDILPAFKILFQAADAMGVSDWAAANVRELLARGPTENVPECAKYLQELLDRRLAEPGGDGP